MQDLENALAQQAPPAQADNSNLHELPPLVIDGIPTPVDKMTQVFTSTIIIKSHNNQFVYSVQLILLNIKFKTLISSGTVTSIHPRDVKVLYRQKQTWLGESRVSTSLVAQ